MGGEFEKKEEPWIYTVYVTLKGIIFKETRFEAMILVSGRLSGLSGCGVAGVGGGF